MSAGGISYSALTTNAKVTLPSVDMWGTDMNILRNPLRSITTRRRDKVGDTQNILLEQDASGDRIAEAISVYPRGVNPMVSVSYDNASNNSGSLSAKGMDIGQASLPYKVQNVRPPIFRQEDLLPLSRLPRVWCHAATNPEYPAFKDQKECPDGRRSIVDAPLHTTVNAGCFNNTVPTITDDLIIRSLQDKKEVHDNVLHGNLSVNPKSTVPCGVVDMLPVDSTPGKGTMKEALFAPKQTIRASTQMDTFASPVGDADLRNQKSIDKHKQVYEAFTMLSDSTHREQGDRTGLVDLKRHIHDQLLLIDARTNGSATATSPDASPWLRVDTSTAMSNAIAANAIGNIEAETPLSAPFKADTIHERGAPSNMVREHAFTCPSTVPKSLPSHGGHGDSFSCQMDDGRIRASVVPMQRRHLSSVQTQRTAPTGPVDNRPMVTHLNSTDTKNTPLHEWTAPRVSMLSMDSTVHADQPLTRLIHPDRLAHPVDTALRTGQGRPQQALYEPLGDAHNSHRIADRAVSRQSFHIPASHIPSNHLDRSAPTLSPISQTNSWGSVKQKAVQDYHLRNVQIRA